MGTALPTFQLSDRIKSARKSARLSQSELASKIGVSDKSISAYEQGRSTPPFGKLKSIASATNHPVGYFTEEDNGNAILASKLASIEKELIEVKKLLLKRDKNEKKLTI